jgi:hypothetical protein
MIEGAVNDLIEKIRSIFHLVQIKAICKNQNFINSSPEFDFNRGVIVAHNGGVAIKLEYNISYNFSLLLDRDVRLIKFVAQWQD